jgi:uncharacterized protein YrrD
MFFFIDYMRHRIILSFGEDEYLPFLVAIGHNLKERNLFWCEHENIVEMGNLRVMHKKIREEIKPEFEEGVRENVSMDMILTFEGETLVRGYLYYADKEYNIVDVKGYASLMIGSKYSYDFVTGVRLEDGVILDLP